MNTSPIRTPPATPQGSGNVAREPLRSASFPQIQLIWRRFVTGPRLAAAQPGPRSWRALVGDQAIPCPSPAPQPEEEEKREETLSNAPTEPLSAPLSPAAEEELLQSLPRLFLRRTDGGSCDRPTAIQRAKSETKSEDP